MIDKEPFYILYCENNGMSNTLVNIMIGTYIIKKFLGLSDDEIVEGVMFDVRLQYPFYTTSFEG